MTAIGMRTRQVLGPTRTGQRTLAGYLLMPRPKDLIKGLLVVATYLLGALGTGQLDSQSLARGLVVLAAVELLVYPARYQWNDVRGFVADQSHPSAAERGRLPGPLHKARAHVGASCAVAAARLAITGLLVVLLPSLHLSGLLTAAVAGVFGVAVVYEFLRSTSTGRSGAVPPPVRPGIVLLWCVVGAGYAVRGMVGLACAIDMGTRPMLAAGAAISLWCYGIAFVTARWAIEATAFATAENGRLTWTARADQAREHLLALARWLPQPIDLPHNDIRDWSPLAQRTAATAPWNLAMVGAGATAALSGRLLCGSCPVTEGLLIAIFGGLFTAAALWSAGRREITVATTALLVSGALTVLHGPRTALAVLPWLLLMGAYLFSTTRTLRKLERPNRLGRLARRIGAVTARRVVGAATWQALQPGGQSKRERHAWATPRSS